MILTDFLATPRKSCCLYLSLYGRNMNLFRIIDEAERRNSTTDAIVLTCPDKNPQLFLPDRVIFSFSRQPRILNNNEI